MATELLAALNGLLQEHRRCGELESDVRDNVVWMACDREASIAHPIQRPESSSPQ